MPFRKSTRPAAATLLGAVAALLSFSCGPDNRPTSPDDQPVVVSEQRVKTKLINLGYVCGNKFRIDNGNNTAVTVTYKVLNTSEQKTLTLPRRSGDGTSYSTTTFTTVNKGTVVLYYSGREIDRQANLGKACPTPPPPPTPGSNPGKWGSVFSWGGATPFVGVHLALLPTGKVLTWAHWGGPAVWTPSSNTFTAADAPSLVFCAGNTTLTDGRVFVAGGHLSDARGLPNTNIFSPSTQTWTAAPAMSYARWYPTTTSLPDGEVLTVSGLDENGVVVPIPEVYQSSGTWRKLTSINVSVPYYPRMFVAPNGKVFYAGEQQATRYIDPAGTGVWGPVLASRNVADRRYGSAVMYEPGKILYVGGGDPPTATAEIINLNASTPTWTATKPMSVARRQLHATLLADGKVLVTGGSSGPGWSNEAEYVRTVEMWDPATGSWTILNPSASGIPRAYHSAAILLPDARVLMAGNGDASGQTDQKSAQIFTPPYLLNSDGSNATRPTISSAPTSITYGQQFLVSTANAASISKASFIRLGVDTHAFDQSQRYLKLTFAQATGGINVTAPANANLAPPGYYMLFILNSGGVPSVAKIVQIK